MSDHIEFVSDWDESKNFEVLQNSRSTFHFIKRKEKKINLAIQFGVHKIDEKL